MSEIEIAGKEDESESEEDRLQHSVLSARLDFAQAAMVYDYTTDNHIECEELGERVFETESTYQEAYNAMCKFYSDEELKHTTAEGTA